MNKRQQTLGDGLPGNELQIYLVDCLLVAGLPSDPPVSSVIQSEILKNKETDLKLNISIDYC